MGSYVYYYFYNKGMIGDELNKIFGSAAVAKNNQ